jgi:phage-related minor tail protein
MISSMTHLSRCIAYLIVCSTLLANVRAQTTTVIPANEAAAHVGQYATVEGVVAKLFTSKAWEHISQYWRRLS